MMVKGDTVVDRVESLTTAKPLHGSNAEELVCMYIYFSFGCYDRASANN